MRGAGAGRKPISEHMEEILFEFIFNLRMAKRQVKRTLIKSKALEIAKDLDLSDFKASTGWLRRFLRRYDLTLRRATNLTRLSDMEVVSRAVHYFSYLHSVREKYYPSDVILMDETAVFFETTARHTIDVTGARHVVMSTTGYSSMRITSILAVRGNGTRCMPANIFKEKYSSATMINGCYTFTNVRAWVDSKLLCEWLDIVFPRVLRGVRRGLIIWDSCRAHISKAVKDHCKSINVDMVVIPGGMTSYLQAGDLCYYKPFKDVLNTYIEEWKDGPSVQYTPKGNPKPPGKSCVNGWVRLSWRCVSEDLILKGLGLCGLGGSVEQTFIANHDVYGENVIDAWNELQEAGQRVIVQEPGADDLGDETVVCDDEVEEENGVKDYNETDNNIDKN